MFARAFHPTRLLRTLRGTGVFADYCRLHGIPFDGTGDSAAWTAALASLVPDAQAEVELELAQVQDLAGRDGNAHLEESAREGEIAPADVPGGAPLALWYLLHQRSLFQAVFFHHVVRDARAWRRGRAAVRIALEDLPVKAAALGQALQTVFRRAAQTDPFSAVEAQAIPGAVCFAARIADRLQLVEGFTERGQPVLQRLRPALLVLFAYAPDGTVLLQSPLRSTDRVRELFTCFGAAVLGAAVTPDVRVFDLERLKQPFHPLPDAADMEVVRLKALHLRYPERAGRRCLKLETLTGDQETAIEDLLSRHVGARTEDLHVTYAELEVRLLLGGHRKTLPIRLWPDRSSLDHTALGERMQRCLRAWGLSHA